MRWTNRLWAYPVLKALAWQCGQTSYLICPLLDARKGEVYGATYRFNADQLIQKTGARAMIPEAVAEDIKSSCVFIGSGARLYRQNIAAALGSLAHFVPGEPKHDTGIECCLSEHAKI